MSREYVIAGTQAQFQDWCRMHNRYPPDVTYVSSPHILRGAHDPQVHWYGTYLDRPDIDGLRQEVAIAQYKA